MSSSPPPPPSSHKTLNFFRIILPETLTLGKLALPKKFISKYGKAFTNSVLLQDPTGETWPVELVRSRDSIYLQNKGWQKFVEHHRIKYGHFLVFRYQNNHIFHVMIFDPSTMEIEYHKKLTHVEEYSNHKRDIFQSIKVEEDEDEDVVMEIDAEGDAAGSMRDAPVSKKPRHRRICSSVSREASSKMATPGSCRIVCKKADKFNPREYPVLRVRIRPSYVSQGTIYLSGNFLKKIHLTEKFQTITLQLSGRSWPVSLSYYQKANAGYIYGGWSAFSTDNHLHEGDICELELVRRNHSSKNAFKVSIVRSK